MLPTWKKGRVGFVRTDFKYRSVHTLVCIIVYLPVQYTDVVVFKNINKSALLIPETNGI